MVIWELSGTGQARQEYRDLAGLGGCLGDVAEFGVDKLAVAMAADDQQVKRCSTA